MRVYNDESPKQDSRRFNSIVKTNYIEDLGIAYLSNMHTNHLPHFFVTFLLQYLAIMLVFLHTFEHYSSVIYFPDSSLCQMLSCIFFVIPFLPLS